MQRLQRWFKAVVWEQWHDFDSILLFITLCITGLGITAIYSVRPDWPFWRQQLGMMVVGIAIVALLGRINYRIWLKWHWLAYVFTLAFLVAVLFVGTAGGGAERWIAVGGFHLQPSEFAKVWVIVSVAAILHRWPIKQFNQILLVVIVMGPPWVLIFIQPNLGTSLVFLAIGAGMAYWGGARGWWLLLLLSPAVAAILYALHLHLEQPLLLWAWFAWSVAITAVAAWQLRWRRAGALTFGVLNLLSGQLGQMAWDILKPYQRQRLLIFMDPSQDPLGAGYHLIQSQIAIGAGGIFGRGFLQGTQTQLDFIPEQHTDFIFAAVGEEMGLMGTGIVICLYWALCIRLLVVAQNASDNFGSLIAIGMFSMVLFQTIVNIGMTIGLMPITGLPLPFMSYGRSALLANFMALGLVESVAKHRHRTTLFS